MLSSRTNPEPIQEILPPSTMAEFLENDLEGYEYVKGELVPMAAAAIIHGEIGINLIIPLGLYVRENNLGCLYSLETTFQLDDRVVKPDIAYVSAERLSEDKFKGFPDAPDLAVEIVSPTDKQYDVIDKVLAYLEAGTRLVWVVEPIMKTVMIYRSETDFTLLTHEDTLTGEDVVVEFSCPVAELFE